MPHTFPLTPRVCKRESDHVAASRYTFLHENQACPSQLHQSFAAPLSVPRTGLCRGYAWGRRTAQCTHAHVAHVHLGRGEYVESMLFSPSSFRFGSRFGMITRMAMQEAEKFGSTAMSASVIPPPAAPCVFPRYIPPRLDPARCTGCSFGQQGGQSAPLAVCPSLQVAWLIPSAPVHSLRWSRSATSHVTRRSRRRP